MRSSISFVQLSRRAALLMFLLFLVSSLFFLQTQALWAQEAAAPRSTITSAAAAEPQAARQIVSSPSQLVPALPVPRLIKFSGVAKDAAGQRRSGVVGITFSIYAEQQGGATLWMETQNAALDAQGRYAVLLGSTQNAGLPLDLFATGEPRWLGAKLELPGEVEQPRVLLVSVPYALKASDADTVGGMPASAFVLAPTGAGANASTPGSAKSTAAKSKAEPLFTSSGTTNYIPIFTDSTGDIGNSTIYQSTAGNVGIGYSNPQQRLVIGAPAGGTVLNATNLSDQDLNVIVTAPGATDKHTYFGPSVATNLTLGVGGVEKVRINSAGNVGIGDSNPQQRLVIGAPAGGTVLNATNLSDQDLQVNVSAPGASDKHTYFGPSVATNLTLGVGGAEMMRITNAGRVGIGTSAPAATLEVNGKAQFDGLVSFASGQQFPGTGTITGVSGTNGITGGGSSGSVTLGLATNTCASGNALTALPFTCSPFATLGANTFTGLQTFAGGQTFPGTATLGANTFTGAQTINNNVTITASGITLSASGGTTGVSGSGGSYGVAGTGSSYGVYGTGTGAVHSYGVYGTGTGSASAGVYGYAPTGVAGYSSGSSGTGVAGVGGSYGVYGYAPTGVWGNGTNYGVYGYGPTGVWGNGTNYGVSGSTSTNGGSGVSGGDSSSGGGYGVWGGSTNGAGVAGVGATYGVYGYSNATANSIGVWGGGPTGVYGNGIFYGVYGTARSDTLAVFSDGNFAVAEGYSKSGIAVLPDDRAVLLYSMESPENWYEDFGSGRLEGGVGIIKLDATFAQTVNTRTEYHVFLTPKGDCKGLYVTNETATGFEVRELGSGQSSVTFDYRIVAKRKGLESLRLEVVSTDHEAAETMRKNLAERPSHPPRLQHPPKPPEQAAVPEPPKLETPKLPQQPTLPAAPRTRPPVPQRVAIPEPPK